MAKQTPTVPQPELTHNQPSDQVYLTPAQELVALDDQLWQQRVDLYKELVSAGKLDEVPEAEDQLSLTSLRKLIQQQRKQNKKSSKQSSNQAKAAATTDFYERFAQAIDKVEEKTTLYVVVDRNDERPYQTAKEVTLNQQVRRQFSDFTRADKPVLFKDFAEDELLYLIYCPKRSLERVSQFDQYDFNNNSHPFLVYKGQLYARVFEHLAPATLHDKLLEQIAVQRKVIPDSEVYAGWTRVWDYNLVKAFPKEDGRYPRSQVAAGHGLPIDVGDPSLGPQEKLAYIKTQVDGNPKVEQEFGKTSRELVWHSKNLQADLTQFSLWFGDAEIRAFEKGISRSNFCDPDTQELQPYYRTDEWAPELSYCVFAQRVFRAPRAEEFKNFQAQLGSTKTASTDKAKPLPEVLRKSASLTCEDIAAWLGQYGWVEVSSAADLAPCDISFYADGRVQNQHYQFTEENLAWFKLLPDGFYAHPPVYIAKQLTPEEISVHPESVQHWSEVRREEVLGDWRTPVYFADLTLEQVLTAMSCKHNWRIGRDDLCYLVLGGQLYQFSEAERTREGTAPRFAAQELAKLADKLGLTQEELAEAFCDWALVLDQNTISHFVFCQDGLYPMPLDEDGESLFAFEYNYDVIDVNDSVIDRASNFYQESVAVSDARKQLASSQADDAQLPQAQQVLDMFKGQPFPNSFRIKDKLMEMVETTYEFWGIPEFVLFFAKKQDEIRDLIICDASSPTKQRNFEENSLPFLILNGYLYRRKKADEEILLDLSELPTDWANLEDEDLARLGWFRVRSIVLDDLASNLLDGRYQLPISLIEVKDAFPQPEDLNALFADFCQGDHGDSSADEQEWDDDDDDWDDFDDDDEEDEEEDEEEDDWNYEADGDDDWDDDDDEADDWDDEADDDDDWDGDDDEEDDRD